MSGPEQSRRAASDRRTEIFAALEQDGVAHIATLATALGVRQITIRRDLERMEQEGLLVRIRGGAVPVSAVRRSAAGGTIGVLVPTVHYFWPGVVRAVEAEAARHGLDVTMRVSSYQAVDEVAVLRRLAQTESLAGLLLAPRIEAPDSGDLVSWLAETGIPHVLVQREARLRPHGIPLESVNSDRALGAELALHHLADLGHRRLGLAQSRLSQGSLPISEGWRAACRHRGIAAGARFEWRLPESREADFSDAVEAMLDEIVALGVTGLLVQADPEALPIIQHAQQRGIRVPEDFSVIAYDDEVAGLFNPPLTAVSPQRDTLGQIAVELLVKRIAEPSRPTSRVLVNPRLIVRKTTAPPPER
ncbi:MAG: substrate-binding domain-containing protein [Propionibacteriaceae bacterium]|nr:substrate-binding domain-containing protein [Propionibacteriaceae bacterium]